MTFLSSLIGTVAKIATTAYSIIKTALPILEALRPAVREVDEVFAKIEQGIASGGIVADDFLDRNLDSIDMLESVSAKGVEVFTRFNELAVKLRVFSQVETPDTITEQEALILGTDLINLRMLFSGWGPELDVAIKKLSEVK